MSPGRTSEPSAPAPSPIGLAADAPERQARRLAATFATRAARHDRDGTFPFENFEALRDAGLLTLTVPARMGGPGATFLDAVQVIRSIASGDASTALVLAMHYLSLGSASRSVRWPPALQQRLVREALDGVSLVNALRAEPELGTPARGGLPATIAHATRDGWRISGRKIYATGSPILRWGLAWARTAEDSPQTGFWLVPMSAAGVRVVETWDHMGMRASGSHDVLLDDVRLPADHAVDVRPPGDWLPPDPVQAAWNAVLLAALYDGVARAARDWLVQFLKERAPSNLGAPLATLPRFQEGVGKIEALLSVSRHVIDEAARAVDHTPESSSPIAASLVKLTATTHAIAVVEIAMELAGNPGLSRTHPLERHYRDALCSRVHTPQNDSILKAAGRAALGL